MRAASGLDEQKAEKAVGIILSLVRTQAPEDKGKELFARFPARRSWRRGMAATAPPRAASSAVWGAD